MADHKDKKKKSKIKKFLDFMNEPPPMKKIKGGKRTVDAVTGPKHKHTKKGQVEHPHVTLIKFIKTKLGAK